MTIEPICYVCGKNELSVNGLCRTEARRYYPVDLDNQLLFALGCGGIFSSEWCTLVDRNDLVRALGTRKAVDRSRLYLLAVFLTFGKGVDA